MTMKLFYLIFILFLNVSCKTTKIIQPEGYQSFKIIKIDTAQYQYNNVFYAKNKGAVYKVVTKKENIEPCQKIELGETYELLIHSTAPEILKNRLDYSGASMYGGEGIAFEGGRVVWDLFITSDIKGNCYQR